MSLQEKLEASVWREDVLRSTDGRCAVTGVSSRDIHVGYIECHHVLSRQQLRRHGHGDKVWDARNGIPLAPRVHERHTLAVERVPRASLPVAAEEFAAELGLTWLLDRVYGPVGLPEEETTNG